MLINLLLLLLVPSLSWAAVDCADGSAVANTNSTAQDPISVSYTRPSGSDFLGFLFAAHRNGAPAKTVTGTSWGASTPTSSGTAAYDDPAGGHLHQLVDPPSGAQTVTASWNVTPLADGYVVFTCTGVNQSTPTHDYTSAGGSSTTASATVSNVTVSDVVIVCVATDGTATLTGGGSLVAIATDNASASEINVGCWYQPGSAGGSVSVTLAVTNDWALTAIAVAPTTSADMGGEAVWFP